MAFNPTDAQLDDLKDRLFLLRKPADTKLPKPANNDEPMRLKLEAAITAEDRFKGMGIGVANFTADRMHPKIWLQNGDDPWRIASTGKLGMLLAAVQLREDVRLIQNRLNPPDSTDYDDLFANPRLWQRAQNADELANIVKIGARGNPAPRISSIFDFSRPSIDFFGPNPDTPDDEDMFNRLPPVLKRDGTPAADQSHRHLNFAKLPTFEFSERLWLACSRSDNLAAASCISEIGLAYIRAVERVYGLYDSANGMHMLLGDGFKTIPNGTRVSANLPPGITYRPFAKAEYVTVNNADNFFNTQTRRYDDRKTNSAGSAAALLAYLIATVQDKLASPGITRGRKTIEASEGGTAARSLTSYLSLGVDEIADVLETHNKIGILHKSEGAERDLFCEYAYLSTKEVAPAPPKTLQYGLVVTGLRSLADRADRPGTLAKEIAKTVHKALL